MNYIRIVVTDEFGQVKEIECPIKLKELYAFYFSGNKKLQQGIHLVESDCLATMKLFKEVYIKHKINVSSRVSDRIYGEIPKLS